ncbi:hypothetical protein MSAN_00550400 [Mycena sanguinolenta]|uniref:Uncharacterized protein n=1 Tax=Mycena sanguinolenta TaxID=230812 RepID=A0A8H7DID8_9AGAR|nr:hypothetical protein MSAN_00550400 [Mycena sanguinolenta]
MYKCIVPSILQHLSCPPRMNRDYSTHRLAPSTSNLSRHSSNVSWGTKIKGAIQVTHGLTDTIRGSLGAKDYGPNEYTSSREIAQRGRHEVAQGLARIRGVTTQLPPAPVYDRRHSYPTQQYEQPQPAASIWGRRPSSAHHRRDNPSTASSPFQKFYEHPYPAQQDQDPGFAGLGAGIDPRRKERNDPIVPAFIAQPPRVQPASSSEMPYPSQIPFPSHHDTRYPQMAAQSQHSSIPHPSSSLIGVPSNISSASSLRNSVASTQYGPSRGSPADPYHEQTNTHRSGPSPLHPIEPSAGPLISELSPALMDHTETTRKGKGKERQEQRSGHNKLRRRRGRIKSLFLASGRHTATRPSSPDRDVPDLLDPGREFLHQTRSAPATPPPHQHESALEHAGYDVVSYNTKDAYPHWPISEGSERARRSHGARLEPVRSVRA